jgi:STAM-binding protein
MTSSQGTDTSISTQTNQSRLAISQSQAAPRPHSIAELTEMAKDSLGEGDFPLKTWLQIAENARRDAQSYQEQGDFESAYVEYAKAATIALEKIPAHPDYLVLLSSNQRHTTSLVS